MSTTGLPELPAPHSELAKYISEHPEEPIVEILKPYREYEAQLRTVYAQDRQNPILNDPQLNVLPLFTEDTKLITTRARDLTKEPEDEKSKYIMPLPDNKRRPHGSPATVASHSKFQKNFNLFSESSLADLNWDNVVAAGSSVVNCLLPVPKEFNTTKRKLREYYHEKFCPASDVDLFLYGLTHDQAIEKIKEIEQAIRDAILHEVTVVRTKYAITIASRYPVRHVQIVLRVYKSISEILTGFDIDAAGGAYDGKQVYVTPRALGSFITQINHVDLSRRSPSYESRLSKYSHRNFEVYWPELDRSRIDPTIFERSFNRTLGLARLLILERLPTTSAREAYLNKRREERGRPTVYRSYYNIGGNIKDHHEDEIADWLSEEVVSNYHTFTVPYGQKFQAKSIEKLCYTRDLLLNAEWNQSEERKVYLHRHPAFFGRVQDVIEDCCGTCPQAKTPDEIEVAEKEAEIYISGKVSFLIDDPGRQQIGSFNPLTEQDWTDMAYVGNTARLCQSIVDGDVDDVLNWLSQPEADVNKRDYTGRSALHLAVMASTPEVVRCLVDHGARLTARLADGRTALHLAASRGHLEIIKILMEKSIENEEAEEERRDRKRLAAKGNTDEKSGVEKTEEATAEKDEEEDEADDESDGELIENEQTNTDAHSIVTGSFVNIKGDKDAADLDDLDVPDDEPDYYQIDVLAWDVRCSPLHLAIAGGHEDAVRLLCDYGADSILPVKFLSSNDTDTGAILTLTLALTLPLEQAKSMAKLLLSLGAVSSQAETSGITAFHRYVQSGKSALVDSLLENDQMGVKTAINHLVFAGYYWDSSAISPLHTAIEQGDTILILKMLNAGADSNIDYESWLKAAKVSPTQSSRLSNLEQNKNMYNRMAQPIISAIQNANPEVALELLEAGADFNALTPATYNLMQHQYYRNNNKGCAALDMVRRSLKTLQKERTKTGVEKPKLQPGVDTYLDSFGPGTYQHHVVSKDIQNLKETYDKQMKNYEAQIERLNAAEGGDEKAQFLDEMIAGYKKLEDALVAKGAKTFEELHPEIKTGITLNASDVSNQEPTKPYKFTFNFRDNDGITEVRKEGYLKLLEAAWSGDLETIKSLTLQAWGEGQEQPPLKIAISDDNNNSPFGLAFFRGHYEVAEAILEIVKAQWSPPEKDKVRYKLNTENEDEESYEDSCAESDSENEDPQIVSEKINQKFTIDDIGHVSMKVNSSVRPLTVLLQWIGVCKSTPLHLCFENDDMSGLKLLIDWAQRWALHKFEDSETNTDEPSGAFVFPQSELQWAIENGKTEMLGLIIKRTGAGIPLDHLVKKSGVELQEKPRFYQGLTVYGKKRKDWATAGRNSVVRTSGMKTPPLLHAALGGSIESVEFFLGDAPHRLYAEFGKSKAAKSDSRLTHLKDSPGGFDRAISKWLGADEDLVIHCAVLAEPGEPANELLEYLIQTCPGAVEKKSTNGETPLMVACRLGRVDFARILIQGNADQSVRNSKGENIIHMALAQNTTPSKLQSLLDLFDPDLRAHLFQQRKNLSENGTAPLQAWVSRVVGADVQPNNRRYYYHNYSEAVELREKEVLETLQLLLKYSNGQGLDMLNGAGDTCLHSAIMKHHVSISKALIDFQPSLLYRENAVGRTPAEAAYDNLTSSQFSKPADIRMQNTDFAEKIRREKKKIELSTQYGGDKLSPDSSLKTQLRDLGLSGDYKPELLPELLASTGAVDNCQIKRLEKDVAQLVIWDICSTAMERNPSSRRLVSLNEANDVARRLGEQEVQSRYFSVNARNDEEDDDAEEGANGPDRKNQEDFAASQLTSKLTRAWMSPEEMKKREKCQNCNSLHVI
ncbi:unnamed protein product [Clonostachys rosea]|uniref:Ankyrin repeat protein n=1 Tax=Bionectria ochroleuca TaxID=29856 RepID=A0ABY6UWE3_BIOOC|nr:unnamed protein product [Clonostachys rosea]